MKTGFWKTRDWGYHMLDYELSAIMYQLGFRLILRFRLTSIADFLVSNLLIFEHNSVLQTVHLELPTSVRDRTTQELQMVSDSPVSLHSSLLHWAGPWSLPSGSHDRSLSKKGTTDHLFPEASTESARTATEHSPTNYSMITVPVLDEKVNSIRLIHCPESLCFYPKIYTKYF